jgi:pyruvate formate lyase activating enzyme
MKIYRWQKESSLCYDDKKSAVVFTSDCFDNCGFCSHNHELKYTEGRVDQKEILRYLNSSKDRIQGVVIAGEETTNQPGLVDFVKEVKDLGFLVKLYTNGTKYKVLQELKNEKLIDYISMDVKGPIELYPLITKEARPIKIRDNIGKSISLISQFPEHEFRTNLSVIYQDNKPRWINHEEIGETAKLIRDWAVKTCEIRYFLQTFKAGNNKKGDERFMKRSLPEEFHETPLEHIDKCLIEAQKHIPNTRIR